VNRITTHAPPPKQQHWKTELKPGSAEEIQIKNKLGGMDSFDSALFGLSRG